MIESDFLRIGEAASFLGVCNKTLRRWESSGRLRPAYRTAGGHRRYARHELVALVKVQFNESAGRAKKEGESRGVRLRAAIYGRVSSSRQKKQGDLEQQVQALEQYCREAGFVITRIYSDVGSGLNDR